MGKKKHYGDSLFGGRTEEWHFAEWAYWSMVTVACLTVFTTFGLVLANYIQNRNFINEDTAFRNAQLQNLTNAEVLLDVSRLNYVLAVDLLKSAAYTVVKTRFNTTASIGNYTNANGELLFANVMQTNLVSFSQGELNDSSSLSNLVTYKCSLLPTSLQVGCAPVTACTNYTFGNITTWTQAMQLLLTLEGVAETAYPTAQGLLFDPASTALVGQLLVMESNHAAYWSTVLGTNPSPSSLVSLRTQNQVLCLLASYVNDANTCVPFSTRQYC